ncbi:VpsF family polysaccharide biosynthesis protein [Hymenobacter sp. HD11105]
MDAEKEISLLPLVLVLFLFLGANVLDVLHYPQSDPTSGAIFRLHPSTYLLFGLWAVQSLKYHTYYNPRPGAVRDFGLVVLLVFVYSITLGKSKANFFILDTLFAPVLLVILLQDATDEFKDRVLYWVKAFFVVNCGLAIVERGLSTIILRPTEEAVFESFRSYALLGHPLNNGLVVGFLTLLLVIISERTLTKFFYLGLGIMAIFSFGARTALGGIILGFPFLLYFDLRNHEPDEAASRFFTYLLLFLVMLGLIGFVLVATPFGERIFASASFDDDSADVRSRVFDMFRHFTPSDLSWGIGEDQILTAMYLEKVDIIENFWIIWIFKYGFVLTALLGLFMLRFLFSLFHHLALPVRFILLGVILLIASGNNSMATNTTAISIITLASLVGLRAYAPLQADENDEPHHEKDLHRYSGV